MRIHFFKNSLRTIFFNFQFIKQPKQLNFFSKSIKINQKMNINRYDLIVQYYYSSAPELWDTVKKQLALIKSANEQGRSLTPIEKDNLTCLTRNIVKTYDLQKQADKIEPLISFFDNQITDKDALLRHYLQHKKNKF